MDASGGRPFEALGRIPGAHACLALAIALAGWLNAIQLWWYLRRADVYAVQPGWRRFLRQLALAAVALVVVVRSEEHTSELQSLMRSSYAVLRSNKKKNKPTGTRSKT